MKMSRESINRKGSAMSQTKAILKHLQSGASITPLEALALYGCMRLGARIWDIRNMGYAVEMKMVQKGNKRFAQYRLKKH